MRKRRCGATHPELRDYGGEPLVFNIDHASKMNRNFRTAIWTGADLQLTLMSIPTRSDIGFEMHEDVDQFICIEEGRAIVCMGNCPNGMNDRHVVNSGCAVIIPAGTWHNVINVGKSPLKLYSVYAPPNHPYGTVHRTKKEGERSEY